SALRRAARVASETVTGPRPLRSAAARASVIEWMNASLAPMSPRSWIIASRPPSDPPATKPVATKAWTAPTAALADSVSWPRCGRRGVVEPGEPVPDAVEHAPVVLHVVHVPAVQAPVLLVHRVLPHPGEVHGVVAEALRDRLEVGLLHGHPGSELIGVGPDEVLLGGIGQCLALRCSTCHLVAPGVELAAEVQGTPVVELAVSL